MSPLSARAVEAATGGALGAGSGALLGRQTYSPKDPAEWLDEMGQVQSRPLTASEAAERSKRTKKGALAGALAGAGGGLGASSLRRYLISKAEREAAPEIAGDYLVGLRRIVSDQKKRSEKAGILGVSPSAVSRYEAAKKVLKEEEAAISDLLGEADRARAAKPFGGITWSVRKGETGPQPVDWNDLTHLGLVDRRYQGLAQRAGFGAFRPDTRKATFDRLIDDLEKKSSVLSHRAFLREFRSILEETSPGGK